MFPSRKPEPSEESGTEEHTHIYAARCRGGVGRGREAEPNVAADRPGRVEHIVHPSAIVVGQPGILRTSFVRCIVRRKHDVRKLGEDGRAAGVVVVAKERGK